MSIEIKGGLITVEGIYPKVEVLAEDGQEVGGVVVRFTYQTPRWRRSVGHRNVGTRIVGWEERIGCYRDYETCPYKCPGTEFCIPQGASNPPDGDIWCGKTPISARSRLSILRARILT